MRNKGFTLIELLAVIVILAIIALIATPIILDIINNSKKESNERSIELYGNALKNAVARYQLDGTKLEVSELKVKEGTQGKEFTNTDLKVEYEGNVVCKTIKVSEDGEIYLSDCKVNGKEVEYKYGTNDNSSGSENTGSNIPSQPENDGLETPSQPEEIPPHINYFSEDSWETIAKNIKEGNTSRYYVGDTREIELKGFENGETDENGVQIKTYTIRIANKTNTGDVCTKEYFEKEDGTKETYSKTACGFVIEFEDLILPTGGDAKMNLKVTNAGGWKDSKMRTYVNNTIYNALPEKLREKIIDTTVVSGYGSGDAPNKVTTDKVYLLSTGEVWEQGTSKQINYDTARENTRQLDYYKDVAKVTTTSNSGAIKKYNGSANVWWLRSAYSNDTSFFYYVHDRGGWGGTNAAFSSNRVAVAFRIG